MRKVIGIGETVLDIIFKDNQPTAAVPGGSTFNAMISLGRSGVPAMLISETGDDRVGQFVTDFMTQNGVDPSGMRRMPDTKSPLSLAFLNENNDAEYIFYKENATDRPTPTMHDIQPGDLVLFGSYYALNPDTRPQVKAMLEEARRQGAIIYYDVNFRPAHQGEIMKIRPSLMENLEMADIVRGSREDFNVLYGLDDAEKVYSEKIAFYCPNFIYTDSSRPAHLYASGNLRRDYPVEKTETVSTIGAGDNFNAGILYGLVKAGITREQLTQGLPASQWDAIIGEAQQFAAAVCKSIYNYVPEDFARDKRKS